MYSIGLDLSLTDTGVILQADGTVMVQESVKSEPTGKNMNERMKRIHDIYTNIYAHIDPYISTAANQHLPVVVTVEGYSFASRSGQAFSLGELGGIIRYNIFMTLVGKLGAGVKFLEIQPTQLKKFVTGKGQCEKDLMLKEVYKNFHFDTNNNNIADAYGLATLGYHKWCYDNFIDLPSQTPYQLEIIKKAILI